MIIAIGIAGAQTLKGVVLDETGKPAVGAVVFLDGTSIGCSTNASGQYSITVNGVINTSLIVSLLGYEQIVVEDPFRQLEQHFVLKPKVLPIQEVVITGDRFTRKQKLKMFRSQLLGLTRAGRNCKILNEDAVTFTYHKDKRSLTASCQKPLVILNPTLGYKITFELMTFEVKMSDNSLRRESVSESLFLGTMYFQEDGAASEKIAKRRLKTYRGSSLDFFRTLRENKWRERRFELYSGSFPIAPDSCFVLKDTLNVKQVTVKPNPSLHVVVNGGAFKMPFHREFSILYRRADQSKVIFKTNTFYLDGYGNISEPGRIIFGGVLGKKRLGDMLPLDFMDKS